jgi:hypothetical protein
MISLSKISLERSPGAGKPALSGAGEIYYRNFCKNLFRGAEQCFLSAFAQLENKATPPFSLTASVAWIPFGPHGRWSHVTA